MGRWRRFFWGPNFLFLRKVYIFFSHIFLRFLRVHEVFQIFREHKCFYPLFVPLWGGFDHLFEGQREFPPPFGPWVDGILSRPLQFSTFSNHIPYDCLLF
jgi:hypothetical protein